MKKRYKLTPGSLTWRCPAKLFPYTSTSEVTSSQAIIGQKRAVDAITLGLGMEYDGYNIFVTGLSGTGRMTTITAMVSEIASKQENPGDWCYVFNFIEPNVPRVLHLSPGFGKRLQGEMETLIKTLQSAIPSILTSEPYQEAKNRLSSRFHGREKKTVETYEAKVKKKGFALVQIKVGPVTKPDLMPVIKDKPVPINELEGMVQQGVISEKTMTSLKETYSTLVEEMGSVYQKIKTIQKEFEGKLLALQKNSLIPTLQELITEMKDTFRDEKCSEYLDEVQGDVLEHLNLFLEEEEGREAEKSYQDPFLRYRVNVIVDNGHTKGRPIVLETHPSYFNLFGAIERISKGKNQYYTDFTHINAGSLLQANGGYLVLNFMDVIAEPGVWTNLIRTLRHNKLNVAPADPLAYLSPIAMKPEPVPLNVKVILIGEKWAYNMAYSWNEDFKKIFKILADFDREMPCNDKTMEGFAHLMRKIIDEEGLRHFSQKGVFALLEYAAREAGRRDKISTRFDHLADIMREANYWAGKARARTVNEKHVKSAVESRRARHALLEDKIQEHFKENTLMVEVDGQRIGQVNALTVYDLGYHRFGTPVKVTARVSMGQEGVVSIEREADMAGNIFTKGSLIIAGYLRGVFTRNKPLSLSATLSFEQSYGGIDGDSASLAETCVLLSAIGGVPIRQDLAITGSMNQMGEAQPIGGVNEKIEGFFDVCREKGLTGEQGVIIPRSNIKDLLLAERVVDAVKDGKFTIYAVEDVTEAAEILMGMKVGKPTAKGAYPKNSLYARVDEFVQALAKGYKEFK